MEAAGRTTQSQRVLAAGPGRRPGDSGRPGGVGPSFGEDEGTPFDWEPRNARMTEEEEAIARRQAAEAAAAGQPPPPLSSADAAAGGGLHTMYTTYVYLYYLRWIHITICMIQLTYLMTI